ncbi:hypothetical protein CHUAL_012204 [Chamberlinius hualienensis]
MIKFTIFSLACLCFVGFSEAIFGGRGFIYTRNAFDRIDGYTFNESRIAQVKTDCNPPIKLAVALKNTAMLLYKYLDFDKGATIIHIRYSNGARISPYPFNTKIFLDDEKQGELVADFNILSTGGWCNFVEQKFVLRRKVAGIRKVYFVFSSEPHAGVGTMNLHYFRFTNDLDHCSQ